MRLVIYLSIMIEMSHGVMNSDGTDPHPITEHANYPSWTPDGRIVYVQGSPRPWVNIVKDYMSIWIMNADGTGKRQLTFNHGMQWTQSLLPGEKSL